MTTKKSFITFATDVLRPVVVEFRSVVSNILTFSVQLNYYNQSSVAGVWLFKVLNYSFNFEKFIINGHYSTNLLTNIYSKK
jgi:hypothetical protein